jgi:hypothetical protein
LKIASLKLINVGWKREENGEKEKQTKTKLKRANEFVCPSYIDLLFSLFAFFPLVKENRINRKMKMPPASNKTSPKKAKLNRLIRNAPFFLLYSL